MDLLKLIDDLRAYRAQVEEAIAAMEELARRRGLTARERNRLEKQAGQGSAKNARKSRVKDTRMRPRLVKPKRGRALRKGKSG
jgi:hypothetical protein